jgi:hypothetical protein
MTAMRLMGGMAQDEATRGWAVGPVCEFNRAGGL